MGVGVGAGMGVGVGIGVGAGMGAGDGAGIGTGVGRGVGRGAGVGNGSGDGVLREARPNQPNIPAIATKITPTNILIVSIIFINDKFVRTFIVLVQVHR